MVHRMTDARERQPLKAFAGQRVHAVAGIGDPNRFFLHLGKAGLKVVPHPFPDHHPFTPRDLEFGDDAAGAAHRKGRGKIAQRRAAGLVGAAGERAARSRVRHLAPGETR